MNKELILVNTNDQVVGYGEKISTHIKGQLHRAYSVFIYCKDEKKFLLQKRHKEKYHSGEKWSNSFCSHPYKDESWFESLQRGAYDELNLLLNINPNFACNSNIQPQFLCDNLFYAGAFLYRSDYSDISEHEIDNVFVYEIETDRKNVVFNPSEVTEVKWLTVEEIKVLLEENPNDFSSWFANAFGLVVSNYL